MRTISVPWTAVKAVGNGKIEGLLIRFTSPNEVDAYGDYFDSTSRIDLEDGDELPVLWHHGLDPEIGKKAIGKGSVKLTKAGWWFTAWLNRRDEYEAYMLEMAKRGKLGYSSGADPSTVERRAIKSGIHHVARWDVIEGSLTPIPADYANQISIKSMMVKAGARHSAKDQGMLQTVHDNAVSLGAVCGAGKAADLRRRRMLMELELIAIEEEYTRTLETPAAQKARLLAECERLAR